MMKSLRNLPTSGPLSGLGLAFALLSFIADQGFKFFMLVVVDIDNWLLPKISIAPFFDIVMAWNKGVSYGLFTQHTELGRWLLVAVSLLAVIGLWLWLARIRRPLPAAGVGMIMGGALANALDRVLHGAVADFFWFHAGRFSWYVFNLADVAIVIGVVLIMHDSFTSGE